jgi:hypothetical protein
MFRQGAGAPRTTVRTPRRGRRIDAVCRSTKLSLRVHRFGFGFGFRFRFGFGFRFGLCLCFCIGLSGAVTVAMAASWEVSCLTLFQENVAMVCARLCIAEEGGGCVGWAGLTDLRLPIFPFLSDVAPKIFLLLHSIHKAIGIGRGGEVEIASW